MSYWFSKSDDELGDEQKWDNGVALVIPLDGNRYEALERGHLLGSVVIFTVIPAKAGIQRPLAANAYLPATGF